MRIFHFDSRVIRSLSRRGCEHDLFNDRGHVHVPKGIVGDGYKRKLYKVSSKGNVHCIGQVVRGWSCWGGESFYGLCTSTCVAGGARFGVLVSRSKERCFEVDQPLVGSTPTSCKTCTQFRNSWVFFYLCAWLEHEGLSLLAFYGLMLELSVITLLGCISKHQDPCSFMNSTSILTPSCSNGRLWGWCATRRQPNWICSSVLNFFSPQFT